MKRVLSFVFAVVFCINLFPILSPAVSASENLLGQRAAAVSIGAHHSAVIMTNGDLYTWGSNKFAGGNIDCGQLGDGTWNNRLVPIKIMENVKQACLGSNHSAAITENGDLYTWGFNKCYTYSAGYNAACGQLGNGSTENSAVPVKIMENVKSVSLGEYHSAAITENGDLYTWGENDWGQLGNGTKTNSSVPIKIMEDVKAVSLGNDFSAAVTNDGCLYTWGWDNYGKCGNGPETINSLVPYKIMENIRTVSLGYDYAAAITEDGSLYTWGEGDFGELGNGSKNTRYSTPVKVMDNVRQVELGSSSSAVIKNDGSLYTFGYNYYGQLGNGTETHTPVVTKVLDDVVSVSMAGQHGAAVTRDGSLYTWGRNCCGELGNNSTKDSSLPIRIISNDYTDKYEEIRRQLGNIDVGPYALKGATIDVLGCKIPLIDFEAKVTLELQKNLNMKIIADTNGRVKVLLGFDEGAKANIDGANNSTKYWSESYQEVKSMYQELTGKKVNTTRLWNKFSSLRGKLKKINASMVVDAKANLTGYLEFQNMNGKMEFVDGGIMSVFDANTSLRSYYGPCYAALGIRAGFDGSLSFTNEAGVIEPAVSLTPDFTITAGGGVGTRSTYAQIDAYGTLSAVIATNTEFPFSAGVDVGVQWRGYILGKEIFSDRMSFSSMELYPNFGEPWAVSLMSLTPEMDVSNVSVYNELINEAQSISRGYLTRPYSLRSAVSYSNASFVKQNSYPLSSPNLVSFDDDTMLLVWIDDTGEKTDENMCSIMYTYFDGTDWSKPSVVYEDGTSNDMPCVYSDGRYAYIVWQKASHVFEADLETSDMLQSFDLYGTVFDLQTRTFTEPFCINGEENSIFEFNPVVCGENGTFTVAWLENSDNNVYQMSGENTLRTSSFNINGKTLDTRNIVTTDDMFTGLAVGGDSVYYALLEEGSNNLYAYQNMPVLCAQGINAFDYTNGLLFYSNSAGFNAFDGNNVLTYEYVGALDDFKVEYSEGGYVLFTPVLNEDFTKDLYYSTLTAGEWSDFEVYSNSGKYIRDYSPVLLSDGAVHVAFNYVEEDMQSAAVVVDQCTNEVDIVMEYVDFDDEQLDAGLLDLRIGIENKSSTAMNSFVVSVLDGEGTNLYTQEVSGVLSAFREREIVVSYILPDNYNSEIYTVQVLPIGYTDLNESNNIVSTTFQCIHDYSGTWVTEIAPTQSTNGVSVLRCSKCAEVLGEQEILQLKFAGASLSLQHNLSINYKVDKALFEDVGYTDPYVVFELNGVKTQISSYSVSGDRYVFAFRNIAPNQMNDTIYATLYATYGGVEYASATREYSVAEYCYSMLALYSADEYAELRTLLVDLLHYGAASQTYTGYRTEDLVNVSLTEEQLLWGTSEEPALDTVLDTTYKTVENPTAKWKGAGLHLQEAVSMRLKFTAESVDGLTVKIESGESIWTIPSDKFLEEDGVYYVYFTALDAGQMRQSVYLTICEGDIPVSNTVCYSIGSYAYEKQNSTIAGLPELVKAMMKYGDSAYAYVH